MRCAVVYRETRTFCRGRNHTQNLRCQDFCCGQTGILVCAKIYPRSVGYLRSQSRGCPLRIKSTNDMLSRGYVLLKRSAVCLRSQSMGCSPRLESANDMFPRGHVPMKYRNTLNINTLFNRRVPWMNTHCTRLHGRGRLDRRHQHGVVSKNDTLLRWRALWKCWTKLDIDTLPSWRAPWIRAQCVCVHGRERLCGRQY